MKTFLPFLFFIFITGCNSGTTASTMYPYTYSTTSISTIGCLGSNSVATVTMAADNVTPSAYIETSYNNNLPQNVQVLYAGACNGNYSSASPSCVAIFSANNFISESIGISFRLNGINGSSNQLGNAIIPFCQ